MKVMTEDNLAQPGNYQEIIDYFSGSVENKRETVRILCMMATELKKLRYELQVETRVNEVLMKGMRR